jgi:hypothetical protein
MHEGNKCIQNFDRLTSKEVACGSLSYRWENNSNFMVEQWAVSWGLDSNYGWV